MAVKDYPLNDFLLWLLKRGYQPTTARVYLSALRSLLRAAGGTPTDTEGLQAALDSVSISQRAMAMSAWRDFRAFSKGPGAGAGAAGAHGAALDLPDLPSAHHKAARARFGWGQEGDPKERITAALYYLLIERRVCPVRSFIATKRSDLRYYPRVAEVTIPWIPTLHDQTPKHRAPIILDATADVLYALAIILGVPLLTEGPQPPGPQGEPYVLPGHYDPMGPISYQPVYRTLVAFREELGGHGSPAAHRGIATEAARSLLEELRALRAGGRGSIIPLGPEGTAGALDEEVPLDPWSTLVEVEGP